MILLLLLIVPSILSQNETLIDIPYVPLTREEAEKWLKSITMDELIDFVIKYDTVEHSVPRFDSFDYVAVVSGRSVTVIPTPTVVQVDIATLQYQVTLPTLQFNDIIPQCPSYFWRDFGIGVGSATAVILFMVGLLK